jgi:hypothetical protein
MACRLTRYRRRLLGGATALHDRRDELDRGLLPADDLLEDSDEAAPVHRDGTSMAAVRSFAGRPTLSTRFTRLW